MVFVQSFVEQKATYGKRESNAPAAHFQFTAAKFPFLPEFNNECQPYTEIARPQPFLEKSIRIGLNPSLKQTLNFFPGQIFHE
jgi:hypothetical protein